MSKTAEILLSKIGVDFLVHRGAISAAQEAIRSQEENQDDTSSGAAFKKVGNRYHATALDGIDLTIQSGMRVGVIGHNGSGKSTLLRVIAGVLEPTRGTLQVTGRIASMMSTTFGFDMRSTGRENITRRGMMMGMSRSEIEARKEDILDFADLGAYTDMPMSTYSAGMRARLGFAITTSMHANIVILDEWIGAGDARFLEKSRERLVRAIGHSDILILATHKDNLIREMCSHVLILDKGKVTHFGPVETLDDHPDMLSDSRKATVEHKREIQNRLQEQMDRREAHYADLKDQVLERMDRKADKLAQHSETVEFLAAQMEKTVLDHKTKLQNLRARSDRLLERHQARIDARIEKLKDLDAELADTLKNRRNDTAGTVDDTSADDDSAR